MDVLITLFSQLIETLWKSGPIGMLAAAVLVGWGTAAYLFLKGRGQTKKTEPTTIDYVSDIKKLHDKYLTTINELNQKYNTDMMDVNEKRISELKEITRDYNQLAADTLATLDRLIGQLSSRRTDLGLTSPGDNNGTESD